MVPFIRSAYNYDREQVSLDTGIDCSIDPETGEYRPSLTQQHFAEEVDINTIVKRFGLTGQLPQDVRMPTYGDFTGISDYRSALDALREADEAFMQFPAHVRARFDNDPARFVDFCSDEANREEATRLGLVDPEKAAAAAAAARGEPPLDPTGGQAPPAAPKAP